MYSYLLIGKGLMSLARASQEFIYIICYVNAF